MSEKEKNGCGKEDRRPGACRGGEGACGIGGNLAGEAAPVYKTAEDRMYTIEDLHAFNDEKRRELIDGKIYVMEAPSVIHQVILAELYVLFRDCVRRHGENCRVLFAPCDVQLDRDQWTMVQPDLFVFCDGEKIRPQNCVGAPDLVVEIMSPSSRSRDSVLKLHKYIRAGVREYWLVDPENSRVLVYRRRDSGTGGRSGDIEEGTYQEYSFTDMIPVGISGEECAIDFSIVARETGKIRE